MKIKTSELTDTALDWAVAKCEGYECEFGDEVSGPWLVPQEGYLHDEKPLASFRPSTDWSQGGPIIEREGISTVQQGYAADWVGSVYNYAADDWHLHTQGPTPLIAAMRCYVAAKLGEEVEIPNELIGELKP